MGEDIEFGHYPRREYTPTHGDVDWVELYKSKFPEEEDIPIWGRTVDELGEFFEQMSQENCAFYMNRTDPSFDVIVVVDPRDEEGNWWIPRVALGDEHFNHLYDNMSEEVMVVNTKYPAQKVVQYIMAQMVSDIETIEDYGQG